MEMMDFTQPVEEEEEQQGFCGFVMETAAETERRSEFDQPSCCPICSRTWTSKDDVLTKEIHVNECLERIGCGGYKSKSNTISSSSSTGMVSFAVNNKLIKTSCPICDRAFESIVDAEIHVNHCMDKNLLVDTNSNELEVVSVMDPLSDISKIEENAANISRCPVCVDRLPDNLARRVRHIKTCANKANVTGPRDLNNNDYEGMLDLLLEEAERLDAEGIVGSNTTSVAKVVEVAKPLIDRGKENSRATITSFFTPVKVNSKTIKGTSGKVVVKEPQQPPKPWRTCPHWKRIPGTKAVVDGFQYAHPELTSIYFLSHFHYDHYIGLTRHFNAGTIYCTRTTGLLLMTVLNVSSKRIEMIPLGERIEINHSDSGGFFVTAFDANHAPGSCVFVFETKSTGKLYVHTGDFRATDELAVRIRHFAARLLRPIESVFLDTTYCDEQYDFLPQDEVIQRCKDMVERHLSENRGRRILVVFGAYTIGKERLALACVPPGSKLAVTKQKMKIIQCCNFTVAELASFTTERTLSNHWIVQMNELDCRKLEAMRKKYSSRFDSVLAIRATGWVKVFKKVRDTDTITTLFVPYSEHSSCSELKRFVRITNPKSVIPTVMGRGANKEEMLRILMY